MMRRRQLLGALACLPAMGVCAQTAPATVALDLAPTRPPPRPPVPGGRLVAASGLSGTVAYALVAPGTGEAIRARAAGMPLPPASTMKTLTALYALSRLGAGHRFRTRLIRAGDMLVLAGGGDPVLDSDGLDRLAADLVASGTPPPARLAVWGGALPRLTEIAPAQADHLAYNPALSGMILNFNRVHLGWRPAAGGAQMTLEARAARHSPRAYTILAKPRAQEALFIHHDEPGRERWTVAASALRRAGSRWLPVRRPELYAGDVFQTLCRARGLALPAPEVIENLPAGTEVAGIDSPPLRELLRDMLFYSTNLTAEVVGLAASGTAGPAASAAAMQGWLRAQGLGQGLQLADHSGLSADSRVTALAMARVLAEGADALARMLKRDPLAEDLGAAPASRHSVAAKTGTLNFVSNLAGRLEPAPGAARFFAILCADLPRHVATSGRELPDGVSLWTRKAKQLQREILANWAALPSEDAVADLGR